MSTRRRFRVWVAFPISGAAVGPGVAPKRAAGERGHRPRVGRFGRQTACAAGIRPGPRHNLVSSKSVARRSRRVPVNLSGVLPRGSWRAADRPRRRTGLSGTDVDGGGAPSVAAGSTNGVTAASPTAGPAGLRPGGPRGPDIRRRRLDGLEWITVSPWRTSVSIAAPLISPQCSKATGKRASMTRFGAPSY
jgi:hypothetical protein